MNSNPGILFGARARERNGARRIPAGIVLCGAMLLVALLCGCFKTKDELTLEADGSGKVRIETRTSVPAEMLAGIGMQMGASENVIYPPLTESQAKKFFPGKAFTVTAKEEKAGDTERVLVVEAAFKGLNALLTSPYARAHSLTLKIESGKLLFKALSGIEAAARLSEMKDEGGMFGAQFPELASLDKLKTELRSEFRVTLPNAVSASNGAQDGRNVTWIAQHTNAIEFVRKAGAVLEASCAADGLKMSPVNPPRLALVSFKEFEAGAIAGQGSAPDAKKVAAAAQFVPYALQVTRSLDLSGDGGSHENQAQLIGGVVLPREFAPQKWGAVKLEEVIDAKGNSLKMETDRNRVYPQSRVTGLNEDDAGDGDKPADIREERQTVTLTFQPPDWKVKEIARIKASISLQYLGAARHIVKMTNAVPASWIKEVSKEAADFDFSPNQRALSSPALPELGLSLNFQMGMAQSAFTMLTLQVGGKKAALSEAQVFDSEGRPWPTFLQQQAFGDEDSCSILIAGRPTAPLSLALLVTPVGADIEIPIVLEKVPVGRK